MAIENNLPIIFDTATQTEDGLMSYQDKIKLDTMEEILNDKLSTSDLIPSSQLDTSSDAVKIQPEHLSDAVKQMMTGNAEVSATVPNNGVTTEKIATNAVTIDKIDKRILLGNIVSSRPLNFAFDTKKVTINIPQGSLLLTDAYTKRILVSGSDTQDVTVNINYPTDFDGLNYITSAPAGTLTMINHRKANTISNTHSIIALVYLSSTYEATIVMNGNYTINGLAQGIGTESTALMGSGKILFNKQTGIIDFTEATILYLITGGVYNRTIQDQSSIRISDYTEESIYTLYWDNTTSSLKTAVSSISNTDTDIQKIALIKDGRIIPFVNTGIYYSIPYTDAPYYSETFEYIDTIYLTSKSPVDFVRETENKVKFPNETYVCLNQQELLVKNKECYYEDRQGLHFLLFDLDTQQLSCKFASDEVETTKKNIVVATFYLSSNNIPVSCNFEYTVDGKAPYQDDLANAENSILELQEIINNEIKVNKILVGDEIYMINGEELPLYESSMLIKTTEGIKPAISYKQDNDDMKPKTEFFNGDYQLGSTNSNIISLLAYDKYDTKSYLKKDVTIKSVYPAYKDGQSIKVMCLGDNLINDKTAFYLKSKLTSLGLVPEMVGTMANDGVYAEGRKGWFYSTFVGASGRGLEEGMITPQISSGDSSILLNPFVRIANADDKANNPNDCYRATGAYVEKNYYNDTDKNGAFYIFDFAKYIEVQGITTPDVVVIAIKPELISVFTENIVSTNMMYLKQLVTGIRAALPNAYIALIPQYGVCTVYDDIWETTSKMITETIDYVAKLGDNKIKVLSSWLHMNREFGTEFVNDSTNTQLYKEAVIDIKDNKLSENAKIELANSIAAFIMNI